MGKDTEGKANVPKFQSLSAYVHEQLLNFSVPESLHL